MPRQELRAPLYFLVGLILFIVGHALGYTLYDPATHQPLSLVAIGTVLGGFMLHVFITHMIAQGGHLGRYSTNLRGKHVIVTGGNNGIGFREAATMAKWGASVTIGSRNKANGEEAVARIKSEVGDDAKVSVIALDLSSQDSVRAFAAEWKKQNKDGRLDILCNNAGISALPFAKSKDGLEMQFATNHVGHFLLTNLLLDEIKEAKGRIICVSADAHRFAEDNIDYDFIRAPTADQYKPFKAYGWSKAANILHALELNNRFSKYGITAYSAHPGSVNTNLFGPKLGPFWTKVVNRTIGWMLLKTPQHGADAILYCCVKEEAQPGRYHKDCGVATTFTDFVCNDDEAARLWRESERMIVGGDGYSEAQAASSSQSSTRKREGKTATKLQE